MFTCLDLLAPLISDPRRPFAVTSSRMGSSAPGAGRQVGPGRWRRRAGMDQGGRRDSPARWCRLIPRHFSGSRRSADVATNSSLHLLLGQDVTSLNNILDVWIGDTCQNSTGWCTLFISRDGGRFYNGEYIRSNQCGIFFAYDLFRHEIVLPFQCRIKFLHPELDPQSHATSSMVSLPLSCRGLQLNHVQLNTSTLHIKSYKSRITYIQVFNISEVINNDDHLGQNHGQISINSMSELSSSNVILLHVQAVATTISSAKATGDSS